MEVCLVALVVIAAIPIATRIYDALPAQRKKAQIREEARLERESRETAYRAVNFIPEKLTRYTSYREYLDSEVWKQKRQAVMDRERGRCQLIRANGRCYEPASQVHHIEYPSQWGGERLIDLRAVCDGCHQWIHQNEKNSGAKVVWATSGKASKDFPNPLPRRRASRGRR